MTLRTKEEIINLLEESGFKVIKSTDTALKYDDTRHKCHMFAAVPIT